jgi:hypothetical protein
MSNILNFEFGVPDYDRYVPYYNSAAIYNLPPEVTPILITAGQTSSLLADKFIIPDDGFICVVAHPKSLTGTTLYVYLRMYAGTTANTFIGIENISNGNCFNAHIPVRKDDFIQFELVILAGISSTDINIVWESFYVNLIPFNKLSQITAT